MQYIAHNERLKVTLNEVGCFPWSGWDLPVKQYNMSYGYYPDFIILFFIYLPFTSQFSVVCCWGSLFVVAVGVMLLTHTPTHIQPSSCILHWNFSISGSLHNIWRHHMHSLVISTLKTLYTWMVQSWCIWMQSLELNPLELWGTEVNMDLIDPIPACVAAVRAAHGGDSGYAVPTIVHYVHIVNHLQTVE